MCAPEERQKVAGGKCVSTPPPGNREHRSWSAPARDYFPGSVEPVEFLRPSGTRDPVHQHPVAALRLPPATISRPSGALPIVRLLRLLTSNSDSDQHVR